MTENEKKRFEAIRKLTRNRIRRKAQWHHDASWLVSKVEELEAELAKLQEEVREAETDSAHDQHMREKAEAELARVKGQRDRLAEACKEIVPDGESCSERFRTCSVTLPTESWREAKKALAELEKKDAE